MTKYTMMISMEVAAQTEEYETYTPSNGSRVIIEHFAGNAAFSPNSVVVLMWKYQSETPEVIWTIKGESPMPDPVELANVDGTNQLALCLMNGEAGPIYLSGYVELKIL